MNNLCIDDILHPLPGADSGLESEGELGQVDEALLAGVRGVEGEGLDEEVGAQTRGVQPSLHLPHTLQRHERVEVAVDAD